MPPIDFASPEFLADPYPSYARLRAMGPLVSMMPRVWLASRYRVAELILRDSRFGRDFATAVSLRYGPGIMEEPAFRMVSRFLLLMNPPEHTRLRALLSKAFGVKQAADLRRLAAAEAARLIDSLADRSEADLVTAFNYPLPIAVICSLLNLGLEDRSLFERETQALVKVLEINTLSAGEIADANAAARTFEAYFREVLRQRRSNPGSDLVSLLLLAEEGNDRLTEDEIIANITLLFLAGHETTANLLGNALFSLFRHPDELARLRADFALIPAAVNECLRYESSVHIAARAALEEVRIDGVDLRHGDVLYINLGAANRDPEAFDDADRFLIIRPDGTPKHLAFGGGIHYCMGARLARIELETGLEWLLRRLPDLRLLDSGPLRWKPTVTIRGLVSLPVAW
jgi:cytochrome P450